MKSFTSVSSVSKAAASFLNPGDLTTLQRRNENTMALSAFFSKLEMSSSSSNVKSSSEYDKVNEAHMPQNEQIHQQMKKLNIGYTTIVIAVQLILKNWDPP